MPRGLHGKEVSARLVVTTFPSPRATKTGRSEYRPDAQTSTRAAPPARWRLGVGSAVSFKRTVRSETLAPTPPPNARHSRRVGQPTTLRPSRRRFLRVAGCFAEMHRTVLA